jgi:glycosyltransferase involved in cell wall biosynthesis
MCWKKNLKTTKKAIIFYGGFLYKAGGVTVHAKTLSNELVKMGWHVSIISLESLPIWCRYIPHLTEKLINLLRNPLGFLYKGYVTRFLYQLFFDSKVDARIFEDIYIAWNSETSSVVVLHAAWSDNLQSFVIGANLQNKLRKAEASLLNKLEHPIVTVSQPYLKYLTEEHFAKYSLRKIDVIELGLDQSNFPAQKSDEQNRKSIVYCGTLEARKNLFFLLEVFKKLSQIDPEFKLTIIGEGPDKESLLMFANANKNLKINFLGRLSHEKVLIELTRHGIYIHTSLKESFSYSLLEAKLSGLKTCAYSGLEVPSAFIDAAVGSFEIDDWCNSILGINWKADKFDSAYYSAGRMTISTLKLLRPSVALTHCNI